RHLVLLALALSASVAGAQETAVTPLFSNQETLPVRIEAPLSTLIKERSDTEYLDGAVTYTDAPGLEHRFDLKLRARGEYRRQRKTCDLPPIRLNFNKKQVMGTEFAGQDKLKLVTHCQNGRRLYEQYVLKEFLAYRIFNTMTGNSFRARLLSVDYVNTERDGETDTRYAFLIEDEDLLAERIGAEVLKVPRISYSQLDAQHAALVSVFEYLIGNTDYSLVVGARDEDCCHNAKLFAGESEGYLAIPYDFDFSGLVAASYAKPNPKLPITRVTRRLYRGVCVHNAQLDSALAQFRDKEPEIRQLVASLEGLEEKIRSRAIEFIDGFYKDVSNQDSVDRHLVRKCL
ncbi:MAG TPA: hypothetical protein VFZ51_01290, partial [Woeseiaceae bacterium]